MPGKIKNNVLNDLTTEEWVRALHSIQEYSWKIPKELKQHLKMGVLTSPELAAQIIRFFTKRNDSIFDPFAGEGGILVGAAMAERLAIGCDLYAENIVTAQKVGEHYGVPMGRAWWGMHQADAIDWLRYMVEERNGEATQDLLFTDPPWGVDHGRTADKGGSVPFNMVNLGGEDKLDIATGTWDAFYEYIGDVAYWSARLLKPGAYALWWFGDRHRGGKYRVVGVEAQVHIEERSGLRLKGVQHFLQKPLNVRRQVFGWGKAFVPLVDHFSLYIYRKEP